MIFKTKPKTKKMNQFIKDIQQKIEPLRQRLLNHELYSQMQSIEELEVFMEHHVFAVWDFMALAKALQNQLTCVQTPWIPVGNGKVRRFINEIILEEESDINNEGVYMSHFEMYLESMQSIGANTSKIELLIRYIETGKHYSEILQNMRLQPSTREFLVFTLGITEDGDLPSIAGAFTFGREDLIPLMFTQIINQISQQHPEKLETFKYYLQRHIELDGDSHGPLSMLMLEEICGNDLHKWNSVEIAAIQALEKRITLWDGILAALPQRV